MTTARIVPASRKPFTLHRTGGTPLAVQELTLEGCDAIARVNAREEEFMAGRAHPFQGPLRDNEGVERVKAGEAFPLADLGKMDWLVEGVIGQPR